MDTISNYKPIGIIDDNDKDETQSRGMPANSSITLGGILSGLNAIY